MASVRLAVRELLDEGPCILGGHLLSWDWEVMSFLCSWSGDKDDWKVGVLRVIERRPISGLTLVRSSALSSATSAVSASSVARLS